MSMLSLWRSNGSISWITLVVAPYPYLAGIILELFFPLPPLFFFRRTKPAVFWDDGSESDAMSTKVSS